MVMKARLTAKVRYRNSGREYIQPSSPIGSLLEAVQLLTCEIMEVVSGWKKIFTVVASLHSGWSDCSSSQILSIRVKE